jgi:hypothetical protein
VEEDLDLVLEGADGARSSSDNIHPGQVYYDGWYDSGVEDTSCTASCGKRGLVCTEAML